MALLLAIESATAVCSVGVFEGDEAVVLMEVRRPRAHAEHLAPLINEALRAANVEATDLDAVAVSAGPGSYTGLRIGVSTAKGICYATGADLVGVPTLAALASGFSGMMGMGDVVVATLQSRRGELYAAAFEMRPSGMRTVKDPAALTMDRIPSWLPAHDGKLWVLGEAAAEFCHALDDGQAAEHVDSSLVHPSAIAMGRLGLKRHAEGHIENLASFEPSYLKPFEGRRARSILEASPPHQKTD